MMKTVHVIVMISCGLYYSLNQLKLFGGWATLINSARW